MENDTTLFQRIGGMNTIRLIVDRFYNKVLSDESLHHFFPKHDMIALRSKQTSFLAYVFGAPSIQSEFDLKKAHAHLKIKQDHFNSLVNHLDSSLKEMEFDERLRNEVIEIIQHTQKDIIG